MKTKIQQSGRSMVEMLGVLAIVGVLSIGGIMGYKSSIEKNKANNLLDSISKSAIIISQKMMSGGTIEQDTNLEGKEGLTFEGFTTQVLEQAEGDSFFEIEVSDLPQKICKDLLERNLQLSNAVYLLKNGTQTLIWEKGIRKAKHSCAETNNTIIWDFDNELDANADIITATPIPTSEPCAVSGGINAGNGYCSCIGDGDCNPGYVCHATGHFCTPNS